MKTTQVTEILKQIDGRDAGKSRKKIVILGAGLAGLVSAYELSRLGHTVEVIEAQDRVGGRAYTCRFGDDYHEFGAMRIPKSHEFTHYYIDQCRLETRPFINHHEDPDSFYFFRGIASTHGDALMKIVPAYRLSSRERQIVEDAGTPLALMGVLEDAVRNITSDPANLDALFARGPMTPYVAELEKQTLYEYLRSHLDTNEAVELVGCVTALEVWWDKAVTMLLRDEITQTSRGLVEIVGGTDLLPTTLYRELQKRSNVSFRMHTEILSIRNQGDAVQLGIRSRKEKAPTEVVDADYVICTIPFGVLRRLELAGLSEGKMRAIRNLTYASSIKVLLHCSTRFWESEKYGIFGAASQTDLVNRQIYYPSDTADPCAVKAQSPQKGALVEYAEREKTEEQRKSGHPERSGVLVGSYCWDADARRLGALSNAGRQAVVTACIAHIHPEIKDDGVVAECKSLYWDEFDWAAGAFCFLRPGDFSLYYADTIKPEGRLYFAGEHCSLDQGWMQGAIESALHTVHAIIAV